MKAGSVRACQSLLGRRLDVRRVDERGLVHGGVLQCSLEIGERVDAVPLVAGDPALGDLVDGRRVEVVQLLPPAAYGRDEVGRLQHREVLAHRLARHVQPRAQLAQGLAVALVETVEQDPPARVSERPEHVVVGVHIGSHLAAYITQPSGCMSRRSRQRLPTPAQGSRQRLPTPACEGRRTRGAPDPCSDRQRAGSPEISRGAVRASASGARVSAGFGCPRRRSR